MPTAATLQSRPKVYPDQIASAVTHRPPCAMCGRRTMPDPVNSAAPVLCGTCEESHYIDASGRLVEREFEGWDEEGDVEED